MRPMFGHRDTASDLRTCSLRPQSRQRSCLDSQQVTDLANVEHTPQWLTQGAKRRFVPWLSLHVLARGVREIEITND